MLHGIDISSHQKSFETDGVDFVFIKATEGRSYVSPQLADQTKRARDAGCTVGFYHFLWPGNIEAQAEYFLAKTEERGGGPRPRPRGRPPARPPPPPPPTLP
ncbi:GH25 family lysozyme, partial [Streptomyces albidoflavus]